MGKPTIIAPGSDAHREMLEVLAEFCGLDGIRYSDGGDREDYILRKGDETLTLQVRGNRYDGAFLVVGEHEEEDA